VPKGVHALRGCHPKGNVRQEYRRGVPYRRGSLYLRGCHLKGNIRQEYRRASPYPRGSLYLRGRHKRRNTSGIQGGGYRGGGGHDGVS